MAKKDHKPDVIARELAELREAAGLTQDQAAELLEVAGGNTISRWETGQRQPGATDYRRAIELYQSRIADRKNDRSATVPRGTMPTALSGERTEIQRIVAEIGELATRHKIRSRAGASPGELERIDRQMDVLLANAIEVGNGDPGAMTFFLARIRRSISNGGLAPGSTKPE